MVTGESAQKSGRPSADTTAVGLFEMTRQHNPRVCNLDDIIYTILKEGRNEPVKQTCRELVVRTIVPRVHAAVQNEANEMN